MLEKLTKIDHKKHRHCVVLGDEVHGLKIVLPVLMSHWVVPAWLILKWPINLTDWEKEVATILFLGISMFNIGFSYPTSCTSKDRKKEKVKLHNIWKWFKLVLKCLNIVFQLWTSGFNILVSLYLVCGVVTRTKVNTRLTLVLDSACLSKHVTGSLLD